jgi:hypothetical protein
MRIEVIQEDIDKGIRRSCYMCPIAIAVRRVFNPDGHIRVSSSGIQVMDTLRNETMYKVTEEMRDFIRLFDNYMEISPFSFDLVPC